MQKEKIAVLGISVGTRKLGISIMKDGELLDWKVTVFKGQWSQAKLASIVRYIDRCATKYQAQVIVLKVPSLVESSPGLQTLITEIKTYFTQKQNTVLQYRISDLKRFCFPNERSNKKAFVDYIEEKFPEVHCAIKKEKRNRNPYYTPMFEAIIASQVYYSKNSEISK